MKTTAKLGKWHNGSETPQQSGWYLRDYRNPPNHTGCDLPPFSVDRCEGGFCYGQEGDYLNGAFYATLPWAKIK